MLTAMTNMVQKGMPTEMRIHMPSTLTKVRKPGLKRATKPLTKPLTETKNHRMPPSRLKEQRQQQRTQPRRQNDPESRLMLREVQNE